MSFKQRVGNFLLLFGAIGLLIFVASVLTPPGNYDVTAFLVGALLFGVGLRFRLSKPSGPAAGAPAHHAAGAAPKAAGKPAGKGGPPKSGPPGGAPKPAGGPPKRQGLLSTILKGPPPKKTAAAPPKKG